MPDLPASLFRVAAMATLAGGLAFTGTSYADTQPPPRDTMDQTSPMLKEHKSDEKMRHKQMAMEQNVEKRIKTLHDKLDITSAQEDKWGTIAQTMRDNESNISQLMQQRHR
jgi:hypothetical protein